MATKTKLNTGKERYKFLLSFLTNPFQIGSITPSSKYLVRRMLGKFNWDKARLIVEYGPGTGCFTKEILKRLHPEAKLYCFEINPRLVSHMNKLFADHPQIEIIDRTAEEINEFLDEQRLGKADAIISGLPFSAMKNDMRHRILSKTGKAIRDDGLFCAYQYSTIIKKVAENYFKSFESEIEPLNIPPAFVMTMKP